MNKDGYTAWLFTLAAIVTTVAALYFAKEILLPIALAVFLSFLLTPVANRLERWGIPRIPTVIFVVGMAFVVVGVLGWIVTIQVYDLGRQLPSHKDNLIAKVKSIRPRSETLTRLSETIEDVRKVITDDEEKNDAAVERSNTADNSDRTANQSELNSEAEYDDGQLDESAAPPEQPAEVPELNAEDPVESLAETVVGRDASDSDDEEDAVAVQVVPSPLEQIQNWLGPPLTAAGLVIVIAFFVLLDRENQRNRLIQLFGRSNLLRTTEAIREAGARVGRYLRMLFLINSGYGVAVALGLWLLGVPSAILWGVLGFALRFLPYIGPWISAVLPILVSVATSDGWLQPAMVVGMYLVYELLLNNVAEPLLYGNSIGVSTVGVILSAIFWTWIWGPIGLVLAMPMTVCLVVLAGYVPRLRFITVLLADDPPLTPSERMYQRLVALDEHEPLKMARSHLKSMSLVDFYDEVLIPALVLAERDRHAGLLSEEQEEFVHEATVELIEELGRDAVIASADIAAADASAVRAPTDDVQPRDDAPKGRVLCIPLRDEADEAAAKILAQLLTAEGFDVAAEGAESLTSELVERVAEYASDLVVISILPPISPRNSRLLWKRLRDRYPSLPIIVGFWNSAGMKDALVPPEEDTATKVATTLAEAVALLRNTAAQLRLAQSQPRLSSTIRDAAG